MSDNGKVNVPVDMQLNIDPRHIEQMVAGAVLQSSIGEFVNEEIKKAIKSLDAYDGPIRKAIALQMQRIVHDMISNEYEEQLRTAVRELLTEEIIKDIAQRSFDALLDKMQRR